MAEASKVYFKGRDELYVALSTQIPYSHEAKMLQSALSAGARLIVESAKSFATAGGQHPTRRTGTLERAIYHGRGRKSTPEEQIRIVNVRKGNRYQQAKGGSRDAYYGRMVEFGHRAPKVNVLGERRMVHESRATTKAGFDRYERRRVRAAGQRGRIRGTRQATPVRPYPFMEPAYRAMMFGAQEAIAKQLERGITRDIKKSGWFK